MKRIILFMSIAASVISCSSKKCELHYPQAQKEDVSDNYFGTEVRDPYRWMENDTTAAVTAWVEAENKVTNEYLSRIPFRNSLKARLTELVDYEKIGTPFKRNGKYYFYKNNGLQNQSVLYVRETLDAEPEVLLDPNTLSDDGTVALTGIEFSSNGKYMAYTISRSGSDWTEIFVMDLATRQLTSDHIVWAKFTGAAWQGDGFYYSAYPAPEEGKEFTSKNENHTVYYHKLGTDQSEDRIEYRDPSFPLRFYFAVTDEDENYIFVYEEGAGNGNRLFFRDLRKEGSKYQEICHDFSYSYSLVECSGDEFYFYTNNGAPKYRLMKACADKAAFADWTEFIPESDDVLSNVAFTKDRIIVTYSKDASDHCFVYEKDGRRICEITLPSLGSAGFSTNKRDNEVFYSFTSFTFPSSIYKFDIESGNSEKYLSPEVKFNPEDYVCEQVFFPSKDSTMIPMFLTYKKGLKLDGSNPAYLYGYGGFNISLTPGFSAYRIPFLENGGIYVSLNLRGGGEYGEQWHLAGTKMNKQNVFDDCISAAEYLISQGYTSPDRLCLAGGSNGGLLVGAVVNQRPDLFAAALPAVGVMDMLRYHKFTIGWNWASDYGTSEDSKEMFEYIYAYSPVNNIRNDGTAYPAILVTTADHDDRVVPAHSFKYAATLQASNTGNAPKLILVGTKAGHGSGKPISKILQEQADTWSFAMYNMNMKPKFK